MNLLEYNVIIQSVHLVTAPVSRSRWTSGRLISYHIPPDPLSHQSLFLPGSYY